jgi:hypothetical protein
MSSSVSEIQQRGKTYLEPVKSILLTSPTLPEIDRATPERHAGVDAAVDVFGVDQRGGSDATREFVERRDGEAGVAEGFPEGFVELASHLRLEAEDEKAEPEQLFVVQLCFV